MRQSVLAARLGLTRAQLSTIEAGRVALRFQTGWNVCKLFDIYPGWLNTGHWSERPFPPSDHARFDRVERMIAANKNTLFSQGWPEVGWLLGPDAPEFGPSGEIIAKPPDYYDPASIQARASIARARTVAAFERQNTARDASEIGAKKILTPITPYRNISTVKSPLTKLIDRVRAATRPKGMKADLAKFLNVPAPRVSEWLRPIGPVAPSGETTLRLLQWVEQQERQQNKSPGGADTLPGPKTQSKASNEKKPRSSHPKP